jgi:hypothetical protein
MAHLRQDIPYLSQAMALLRQAMAHLRQDIPDLSQAMALLLPLMALLLPFMALPLLMPIKVPQPISPTLTAVSSLRECK